MSHFLTLDVIQPVRYRTEDAITVNVDAFVTHYAWNRACDGMETLRGQLDPATWEAINT